LTGHDTTCFAPAVEDYTDATYGDRIAPVYDSFFGNEPSSALAPTIDLLAGLAAGGPALELGIGTGRIALPLLERGVEVHGIDASASMVEKLREKPGGDRIPVTMGSFAEFDLGMKFALVFVAFNTLFALRSQDEQISCLRSVRRHLTDDGAFVMEAFVPNTSRFVDGQRLATTHLDAGELTIEASVHAPVDQRVDGHHVVIRDGEVRIYPVQIRYAYVAELDLMARVAGLRVRDRWSDWDRSSFNTYSGKHITVYELDREP
jgi:phospholipid N-methyltransferase